MKPAPAILLSETRANCGLLLLGLSLLSSTAAPIDRQALVTRHNVTLTRFDVTNPLSVGNGEFCFTMDATGLQTFPEAFENTTPLGTLSDWGWHTIPNTNGWDITNYPAKLFPDLNGRPVPYPDVPNNKMTPEARWLRDNPHRLHLGQIGFILKRPDGTPATTNDLTEIEQKLDLWNGEITSHFKLDGEPVAVETACDPGLDAVAVHVESPLLKSQRLAIQIHFPYGTADTRTADWTRPDAHETIFSQPGKNAGHFARIVDQDRYVVDAQWSDDAVITNTAKHEYQIVPGKNAGSLELVCAFASKMNSPLPTFAEARVNAQNHWNHFWKTGGAIDLSGSVDPRWFELERRIVLSQYLTAIQSAGKNPPAETGLTYNSWGGKFHLEMHFWHEAHFALWNRVPLFENSLDYYQRIWAPAVHAARRQGYHGARWPKMTSPGGADSPSPVGPFLVWQEPHEIFYAELCYRARPDRATLEEFANLVFSTADFMASYAAWDTNNQRYVLGPTLQTAQEIFPKDRTLNPTFELTYWRWALQTAQLWRARFGLPPDDNWSAILIGLSKLPVADGKYLFTETTPDSYTNPRWNADHPAVLDALAFVPGPGVDLATMRHTFDWVWKNWNWPTTWGWDYPAMAMTAARLGDPERAVDALLLDTPKNHYGLNGHVYQRPGLTVYLPANGGLLYAVALMTAGWDGAPARNAPGFPDNGQWNVRWENLSPAP